MTAIIGFQVDLQPIMFGDLLLSREIADASVQLPTLSNIAPAFRKKYSPAGLAQKVAIISDQLVIAWSGRLDVGASILSEMKAIFGNRRITEAEITTFFGKAGEENKGSISLLGMLKLDGNRIYQCSFDAWGFEDARFGLVRMAGSGRAAIADVLKAVDIGQLNAGRTLNPLEKSIGLSLTMTGYLQGREVATAQNFDDFYGGGYEIATLVNGCWSKLGDTLMVYWLAEQLADGRVTIGLFPHRLIRTSYADDIMVIRSISGIESKQIEDRSFVVPPVYRVPTKYELSVEPPEINAPWICHQFIVRRSDGTLSPRSRVTYNQNPANAPLRLEWDGNQFEVIMAPKYHDILREFAQNP